MAVDTLPTTSEDTASNEDENPTSEKAKRERVDLEKLDPNERVQLNITVPAGMKLALIKAGEGDNLAASAYARNVLANTIGYTVPASFTERTRSHKYESEEARIAAQKERNQQRSALAKKLMALAASDPEIAAKLAAME